MKTDTWIVANEDTNPDFGYYWIRDSANNVYVVEIAVDGWVHAGLLGFSGGWSHFYHRVVDNVQCTSLCLYTTPIVPPPKD